MKPSLPSNIRNRRRGLALIIVITTISLISVLIVAIFSVTRTEFKATQSYVAGRTAKQLGDMSVAIVQAQIQNGQNIATGANRTTHATQPGMVRVYNSGGGFTAAYKLYSSAQMKVEGEEASLYSAAHIPPSDWATKPARFVDLNEPVVRPGRAAASGNTSVGYAVYYPVIDPRAAWNYGTGGQNPTTDVGTTQVEGFSYTKKTQATGSGSSVDYSSRVVTPTDTSDPRNLRLPMPVEWLYVLEDGTVGALDDQNKFIKTGSTGGGSGSTPGEPTVDNPIIGRIAFWADDESCKININTASEPTFTNTPFFYHERDSKWAHFPPVTGEYQRYPGHPATVALSAVLAPNYRLDPLLPDRGFSNNFMDIVNLKEEIYKLAPKITGGGSESGTRPFTQDDLSSQNGERSESTSINLVEAAKERLYASVDEMLFKDGEYLPGKGNGKGRVPALIEMPDGKNFFDHDRLERSRFFLTAHSRSPEFSIHGLPRVCVWPVADESLPYAEYRTSFDNAIALCATIGKTASSDPIDKSYFFRRAKSITETSNGTSVNAIGSTYDLTGNSTLRRNDTLLKYLVSQMTDLTWPATSFGGDGGRGSTFQDKYGNDNINQLAVQFFDYVRSTNLYDGILARKNNAWSANGLGTTQRYEYRDSNTDDKRTYTTQRVSEPPRTIDNVDAEQGNNRRRTSNGGVLPGHGMVSPAIWENGKSYKGFGRMFTLSEIGFQFICTADGQTNHGALNQFVTATDSGRGGAAAPRLDPNPPGDVQLDPDRAYPGMTVSESVWFSNFPPLTTQEHIDAAITNYGCQLSEGEPELHPSRHPGFDPANWNLTLAAGTPLQPDQKRVQVMLMLEAFCPSLGWTSFFPEFTIVLDGTTIGQMTMNGQRLFNTTGDIPIKSFNNIYAAHDVHAVGGHAGPSAIAGGRRTRSISNGGGTVLMPVDIGYDNQNTSGHQALQNFTFVSDFVTVDRNKQLEIAFPGEDIKIEIYDTHAWENATPIQTMYVNFSQAPNYVPVPNLVGSRRYSETIDQFGRIRATRSRQGPHYWCGNYGGCLGRMSGQVNPRYGMEEGAPFWQQQPQLVPAPDGSDAAGTLNAQVLRGRLDTTAAHPGDSRQGVTWNGISITANGVDDVIRTLVPTVGDYRVIAAMRNVPASFWKPHPLWKQGYENLRQAHSFTSHWATSEPGAKLAQDAAPTGDGTDGPYQFRADLQLVGGARHDLDARGNIDQGLPPRVPDLPPDPDYAAAANAFGDFDTGLSSSREGPYINKPDEGNFHAANELRSGQTKYWRASYFYETWENAEDWRSGIYMTPNRLISSPVMFGSLPTGVWGNTGGLPGALDSTSLGSQDYAPWQTLLYRPHANITNQDPSSNSSHPGLQNPHDHYTLEMFFMPVVEPYAISEPLSVAGRVNMNYQIMPFTHIRRATGMHAVMKGEFITAIPNNQVTAAKNYYPGQSAWNDRFWNDDGDKRYWHRQIDVPATLRQFDLKFSHQSGGPENYQGLFRSASQICEMHLIPRTVDGSNITNPQGILTARSQDQINDTMSTFWGSNRSTGDNVRERSYSNLYARLTTRSNTFRVHVRAQAIRKARSVPPNEFDASKDTVVSEYRGSTLFERYIDPNDADSIPDYADEGITGRLPLDAFYRFRALETKRFSP